MTAESLEGRIAIVGLSLRFPGAKTPEQFFENLLAGRECIKRFSPEELLAAGHRREDISAPDFVPAKPVLDDVDRFDANFFGFSEKAAEMLDPQHRIFLECAHEALERAGYDPARYPGWISVFAGCNQNTYLTTQLPPLAEGAGGAEMLALLLSSDKDYLATRVAYKLDLKGAAVTVQSACSTGLVAVHLASQALLGYQCDMALAGAISLRFPQASGYRYEPGGVCSPDGHCRPFDSEAGGTVFGEGVGVVVLKRLSDALADGDYIHAVIAGSGINNDGAGKVGFSAPSLDGQASAMELALRVADVEPEDIGYVEAHGTGTSLGDRLEVHALRRAYSRVEPQRIVLGSVKSNFGHADTAAGMAGLFKAICSLEHGEIPPTLHFRNAHPALELEKSPFVVLAERTKFPPPRAGQPRRAAVNSVGMGGTNAHLVLEQAPPRPQNVEDASACEGGHVLLLSAKTSTALGQVRDQLRRHLEGHPDVSLADVAFTLREGRTHHAFRDFVVAADSNQACARLIEPPSSSRAVEMGAAVALLFSGQGSEFPGMGHALHRTLGTYREVLDEGLAYLRREQGLDLAPYLDPRHGVTPLPAQTALVQPALFLVEVATARALASLDIVPKVLLGHSLGELAAACVADVFSLHEGLSLVALRGRLAQGLAEGRMLAVRGHVDEVAGRLTGTASIAAINAERQVVVAGSPEDVAKVEARLAQDGIVTRMMQTRRAFHSPLVEPMMDELRRALERMHLSAPRIPLVAGTSGELLTPAQATSSEYWVSQLRLPVRFARGVSQVMSLGARGLVEVGPGTALINLVRQSAGTDAARTCSVHPADGSVGLPTALGVAWVAGSDVAWSDLAAPGRRVELPTYPFERRRYFPATSAAVRPRMTASTPQDTASGAQGDTRETRPKVYALGLKRIVPQPKATTRVAVVGGEALCAPLLRELTQRGLDAERLDEHLGLDDVERSRAVAAALAERNVSLVVVATSLEQRVAGQHLSLAHGSLVGFQQVPSVRVVLLTSGASLGEGEISPEAAATVALVRTLRAEQSNARASVVDLQNTDLIREHPALVVDSILSDQEPHVIVRRTGCFVPQPSSLELVGSAKPAGGVYLLVGGLGDLGRELLLHLANKGPARFAVVSRSPLPERSTWPSYASRRDAREDVAARIDAILRVEALGGEVVVYSGDARNEDFVHSCCRDVERRFGCIDVVFHLAATVGSGALSLRLVKELEDSFATKVRTARALAMATSRQTELVFFSSLLGWTGAPGQGDYAAANAALDALALELASSRRCRSLAWDGFAEVGMAARAGFARRRPLSQGPSLPARRLHPLLEVARDVSTFEVQLRLLSDWIVFEHRVAGQGTVPGTALLEMVCGAFRCMNPSERSVVLENVEFRSACSLESEQRDLRVELGSDGKAARFVVSDAHRANDLFAAGSVRALGVEERPGAVDLAALRRTMQPRDPETLFHAVNESGVVRWGPRWNCVRFLAVDDRQVLAEVALDISVASEADAFLLHPALFDVATAIGSLAAPGEVRLPAGYERIVIHRPLSATCFSHVSVRSHEPGGRLVLDGVLTDGAGQVLVEFHGFTLRSLTRRPPRVLREALDPAEAFAVMDTLLATPARGVFGISARRLSEQGLLPPDAQAPRPTGNAGAAAADQGAHSDQATRLLAIFRDLLGQPTMSRTDNFFAMGGDSLLALQVAARAQQAGIVVSAAKILEHGTVAALEAELGGLRPEAASASRFGPTPLVTHQRWFFSTYPKFGGDLARWNMGSLLALRRPVSAAAFRTVLTSMYARHDVARARFNTRGEQIIAPPSDALDESLFRTIHRPLTEPADQRALIERVALELQDSMSLTSGGLIRMAHFDFGEQPGSAPPYILAIGHHLILDAACFSLFLQELDSALRQVERGSVLAWPEPNTNFRTYALALDSFVKSAEFAAEAEAWRTLPLDAYRGVPYDFDNSRQSNVVSSTGTVQRFFSNRELARWSERHAELGLAEIVRAAFTDALIRWSDNPALLFKSMNSGRFALPSSYGVDLSRSIGPFAFGALAIVARSMAVESGERLVDYARAFASLPREGLSAEMLVQHGGEPHLVSRVAEALRRSEVLFNYYLAPEFDDDSYIVSAEPFTVGTRRPEDQRPDTLECTFVRTRNGLLAEMAFSKNLHRASTVEHLLDELAAVAAGER